MDGLSVGAARTNVFDAIGATGAGPEYRGSPADSDVFRIAGKTRSFCRIAEFTGAGISADIRGQPVDSAGEYAAQLPRRPCLRFLIPSGTQFNACRKRHVASTTNRLVARISVNAIAGRNSISG